MNSTTRTKKHQALNVIYVFSNNNQVYIKKTDRSQQTISTAQEEWLPIPFRWES